MARPGGLFHAKFLIHRLMLRVDLSRDFPFLSNETWDIAATAIAGVHDDELRSCRYFHHSMSLIEITFTRRNREIVFLDVSSLSMRTAVVLIRSPLNNSIIETITIFDPSV
jgi:hypothetical protein